MKEWKMRKDETSLQGCRLLVLRPLLFASFACLLIAREANARQQPPELLAYDELVQLYEQETPSAALQDKLNRLLTTPFVSNAASARGGALSLTNKFEEE